MSGSSCPVVHHCYARGCCAPLVACIPAFARVWTTGISTHVNNKYHLLEVQEKEGAKRDYEKKKGEKGGGGDYEVKY